MLHVQFNLETLPSLENEWSVQFQQNELPVSSAYVSASQIEHDVDALALLYVPTSHSTQDGVSSRIVPTGHAVHGPPSGPL